MSREAVTMEASFPVSAGQLHEYLRQSAELTGGPEPLAEEAEVLSTLELTAVAGDSQQQRRMSDLKPEDPLDVALSVGFGGKDAVGIKQIEENIYLRVGADTIVQDALAGGPAEVEEAERFMRRAAELPPSLDTASRALTGAWVLVDPHLYYAYGEALSQGTGPEGPGVDREMADRLAAALSESAPLLEPEAQWNLVEGLGQAAGSGAVLRDAGEGQGAQLIEVELSAGAADRALAPLLGLLEEQSARFGLPTVVHDPVDPRAKVTAELAVRNGVLSQLTFDLGQFAGEDFAELPLQLNLNSGSAISLTAPEAPMLQPEDLTVALLYMELREQERENEPGRGNIPGPIQP